MIWTIPDNPPKNPDCFVINSYALRDRFTPTRPTRAQIDLAYEWWQNYPEAKLIMCTGDNQRLGITNARVMADYAVTLGIPRSKVIEEDKSRNTYENLCYSMAIIEERGFKEPALVTIDLYTRRAVATAKKLGWGPFYWLSTYSKGESGYGHKWLQTHSRFTILCYEMAAMTYSKMVGWV
jgi:uncharacterized SAM-binding protein YcdF (DUF218 family)